MQIAHLASPTLTQMDIAHIITVRNQLHSAAERLRLLESRALRILNESGRVQTGNNTAAIATEWVDGKATQRLRINGA